jgi:hypothetical protein
MNNAPPSSRRFQRSVVRVDDGAEAGTAFLIHKSAASGTFITVFHVVSSAWHQKRTVLLRRTKDQEFPADIVAVNETRDLALLVASKMPSGLGLRPTPISTVDNVGRLTVLSMLDPEGGIVAPLPVTVPFIGETAVAYEVGGVRRFINEVWSQQGLKISFGTSGAPVISEEDDAAVAVACAGADAIEQTFFVPLLSAQRQTSDADHRLVAEAIGIATEASTRLGRIPNERGVKLRCWLQCRASAQSLVISGVYDRDHTIPRTSLDASIERFLASSKHVAILAGTSGSGKSVGLARIARSRSLSRPCLLLRAAQIKITERPLEDALASALGMPDADSVSDIATYDSAPLLIIDGINELGLRREDWPAFVQIHLAHTADLLKRKGWKLLISTRSDRLDDLQDADRFVSLYDPTTESEAASDQTKKRRRTKQAKQAGETKLKFIRTGAFERDEFDRLIKLHGLPGDLPFADLRHPIVFRLMVETYKKKEAAPIRIRSLFEDYFSTLVTRIHVRCPGRSKDRISKMLESWTALPETTSLGYIDSASLDGAENEAIAEAAVAEGLLERAPNGYRYVYDEIFDFVRAKPLVGHLARCSDNAAQSVLEALDTLLGSGGSPWAVARAFEMLSDSQPEALVTLAEKLATELKAKNVVDTSQNGYMAPVLRLANVVRVLTRVEKGGPLDRAKDELPLFGIDGADPGEVWDFGSFVPYAASEDHISYAFDEERMWRMIRLAATFGKERTDSYPFRSKDILDDDAHDHAKDQFNFLEKFMVLRHFVSGFPQRALTRLMSGLSEKSQLGREHTFGSFCAQVIAVYADRFELTDLMKLLVAKPDYEATQLLVRLFLLYPAKAQENFFSKDVGLPAQPERAASILSTIASAGPTLSDKVAEIAAGLISNHGHSVFLYSAFFERWKETPFREFVATAMLREWHTGKASVRSLIKLADDGLLPSDELFDLILERLRSGKGALYDLVSPLSQHIGRSYDSQQKIAAIDKILAALWEGFPVLTDDHTYAAETLLNLAVRARSVSPSLEKLLERICTGRPQAATALRYPICKDDFGNLSEPMQLKVCDLVVSKTDRESAFGVLSLCLERVPKEFRTRYVARILVSAFGSDFLFEIAASRVEAYRSMESKPSSDTIALIEILKELDPGSFQRYRDVLQPALDGGSE